MSTPITQAPTPANPSQNSGQAGQIVTSVRVDQQQQAKALVAKLQQGLSLAAHLKPVSSQKIEIQVGSEKLQLDLPRSLPNLSEQSVQISGKTTQGDANRLLLTLTGLDSKALFSNKGEQTGTTTQTQQSSVSVQSSLPQRAISGQLSLNNTTSQNTAIDQFLGHLGGKPSASSGISSPSLLVSARLLQILPPGQPTPTATSLQPPTTGGATSALSLVGTVAQGNTSSASLTGLLGAQSLPSGNGLTLQTELGSLRLPGVQNLPAGTRIQMALLPLPNTTSPLLAGQTGQGSAPEIAAFNRLSNSLSTLPQNERSQIDALFPKADQQLAKASLFLAGLLKEGQGDQWLSKDHIRALDNASPQLGQQINNEIGALRPQSFLQATDGSEWLKLVLPMFGQQQADDISLFWQKQDGEDNERQQNKGPKSQRFIIETRFTQFGLMQLDGRYMAEEKKLDLMVRTRTPLDASIRNGIRDRYHEVMQAGGLKGMIDFHVTNHFPVEDPERPHVDTGLKV